MEPLLSTAKGLCDIYPCGYRLQSDEGGYVFFCSDFLYEFLRNDSVILLISNILCNIPSKHSIYCIEVSARIRLLYTIYCAIAFSA